VTALRACTLAVIFTLAACSTPTSTVDASTQDGPQRDVTVVEDSTVEDSLIADSGTGDAGRDPLVIARPFRVRAPGGASTMAPMPLVLLLHGYGANAMGQDAYFALGELVNARRFVLALPDGTIDASGRRFWNATDACCDFARTGVDDVAYIRAIIDDVKARYPIDAGQVFVIGHSNGGFMALRVACELSDRVAAVMSLAGAGWSDASRCRPTQPVHVLQVHGTADAVILYAGGTLMGAGTYPSAERTVSDWAQRNSCNASRTSGGAPLDLESALPGAETIREVHAGCREGGSAELWAIQGGSHIPVFGPGWAPALLDWLFAHGRRM
jgi:polyhydroxybutyrate depolymerase